MKLNILIGVVAILAAGIWGSLACAVSRADLECEAFGERCEGDCGEDSDCPYCNGEAEARAMDDIGWDCEDFD